MEPIKATMCNRVYENTKYCALSQLGKHPTDTCACVCSCGWGWELEITYNATFSFRNYHNRKSYKVEESEPHNKDIGILALAPVHTLCQREGDNTQWTMQVTTCAPSAVIL